MPCSTRFLTRLSQEKLCQKTEASQNKQVNVTAHSSKQQMTGKKLSTYLLAGPFVSITYPDIANSGPATHACFQPKPSDTSCGCAAEKKSDGRPFTCVAIPVNSTSTNALTLRPITDKLGPRPKITSQHKPNKTEA